MGNDDMSETVYDAIVVGSGITGGWAAKELTERGLRVLVIERGREVRHGEDYTTEHKPPSDFRFRMIGDRHRYDRDYPIQRNCPLFNEASEQFFVNDRENPYSSAEGKPFQWLRGHQLGGRSLTWGRQSYRLSALNFQENGIDGNGVEWPIGYEDLAPWYSHVERFIGVAGEAIGNPMSPDGEYQPPFPLNVAERDMQARFAKLWPERPLTIARTAMLTQQIGDTRMPCHYCGPCERGCSTGSYFSSLSSTLPAALATGRLEIVTDKIARRIIVDPEKGRASGVEVIDARNRQAQRYRAHMVFLCASALESVKLLLLSGSDALPAGLANSSGAVGRYIMDHHFSDAILATVPAPQYPHLSGYRSIPFVVPRFRNVREKRSDYVRGYQLHGGAALVDWSRGIQMPGVGADFKQALRKTGDWAVSMLAQCEALPVYANRVTLNADKRDKWDLPLLHMDVAWVQNDIAMRDEAGATCLDMMQRAGYKDAVRYPVVSVPGAAIHEMGGAVMGKDRRTSVLDANSRAHDVPNLFITDGAAMSSSSNANPSLTYMAMTARAASFAAQAFKTGTL